ncbi:hypothetical protein SLEP1_g33662 [Rubroshorea leprosula]|uniref:Xylulokinase n=1 Tax=Rubroshorea leprosula TaxID=152421 RepID=A0AAV5KHB8_9ROSI|nr:hypothetical protein SLEP1_g33662 [Rubroshorea leprosula]
MWVEALDLVLQKLSNSNLDFGKIAAVSGSGQQHGSVYWKNGASAMLSSLDSRKPLVEQLRDAFSTKESPIWMDSSTTGQCREIKKAVGGALELSKLTGSFSKKIFINIFCVSLVSLFLCGHPSQYCSYPTTFNCGVLIGSDTLV